MKALLIQSSEYLYFGEVAAISAALSWSIAVIIFKSASRELSPQLITALKNTIAFICFMICFVMFDIPFWYSGFEKIDYIKIIISGCLGMGIGDVLFIYALSKIGANRVAIINCFEPVVIYFFSFIMLGTMLTLQQLSGFIVVIISILIIAYEKDDFEISSDVKLHGMLTQILAVLFSSFGIVLIKPVLEKTNNLVDIQIWVTVFRLFPGLVIAWIIFGFQKQKNILLRPLKKSKIIWKILISSGLGTFIALSFWILGYANIEKPPIASILGQTSMVFIVILSYFLLKEHISKSRLVSILFALGGVVLIILK